MKFNWEISDLLHYRIKRVRDAAREHVMDSLGGLPFTY